MSRKSWIVIVVLILISAFVLIYASPALLKITDVDYAIFQYTGQQINEGKLPYVDFYDHKPPAMFYLDALVLAIAHGSRWGIWAYEFLSLSAASILCFFFLKKYFGNLAAFLATIAFLLNLTYFHNGGNLTEEYALPFQFGVLIFLSRWAEGKKTGLNAYLIGLFAGIASTFKQPMGAIILGAGVFMLVQLLTDKKVKRFLISAGYILAGVVTVWGAWFLLYTIQGILYPFWEAAFAFNFAWSSLSTAERISTFGKIIVILFNTSPFFMLAMLSYIVVLPVSFLSSKAVFQNSTHKWISVLFFGMGILGIYNGLFRRGLTLYPVDQMGTRQIIEIVLGIVLLVLGWAWLKSPLTKHMRSFLDGHFNVSFEEISLPMIVCLVDFPVQLGMISLSGNNFAHYFMSALPAFSILMAFFLWFLQTKTTHGVKYVWIGVLVIPIMIPALSTVIQKTRFSEDYTVKQISQYVVEHTSGEDEIFIWGNLVPVLIESGRDSSSSFFFIDPLFLKGYTSSFHTDQLMQQFLARTPQLIIATPNENRPLFYMENAQECNDLSNQDMLLDLAQQQYGTSKVFIPDGMPQVYTWICKNYTRVNPDLGALTAENLQIYQYTPGRE